MNLHLPENFTFGDFVRKMNFDNDSKFVNLQKKIIMTVTIEFNEKEQTIFKQIAQRQQALQQEINATVGIMMASKGYDIPATGVNISQDLTSAVFEVEYKKEDE